MATESRMHRVNKSDEDNFISFPLLTEEDINMSEALEGFMAQYPNGSNLDDEFLDKFAEYIKSKRIRKIIFSMYNRNKRDYSKMTITPPEIVNSFCLFN